MASKKSLERRVGASKDALPDGERLQQELLASPAEHFETLTFGELQPGDWYICLPLPGDNDGHGGYRGLNRYYGLFKPLYIFKKLPTPWKFTPTGNIDFFANQFVDNSARVYDGNKSHMSDSMLVVKVR